MTALSEKSCKGCSKQTPALSQTEINHLLAQLDPGWELIEGYLTRKYTFKNFKQALAFTNKVGELADTQDHHPDIYLAWAKVELKLITHVVNALTENDFILAAKIDQINV